MHTNAHTHSHTEERNAEARTHAPQRTYGIVVIVTHCHIDTTYHICTTTRSHEGCATFIRESAFTVVREHGVDLNSVVAELEALKLHDHDELAQTPTSSAAGDEDEGAREAAGVQVAVRMAR